MGNPYTRGDWGAYVIVEKPSNDLDFKERYNEFLKETQAMIQCNQTTINNERK